MYICILTCIDAPKKDAKQIAKLVNDGQQHRSTVQPQPAMGGGGEGGREGGREGGSERERERRRETKRSTTLMAHKKLPGLVPGQAFQRPKAAATAGVNPGAVGRILNGKFWWLLHVPIIVI